MSMNELDTFLASWDREAANTVKLLRALPATQYDFRPDAGGRSLGELAWHLAEGDAYMSYGIEQGGFSMNAQPPNIERPRTVEALAPGYERIHREAVERVRKLKPEDLERSIPFFAGPTSIRDILWGNDHLPRRPPSRPAHADVSTGRWQSAGAVRSQPRRG